MENNYCIPDFQQLGNMAFLVEKVYVARSFVTPPSKYVRRRGSLKKNRFFYVAKGAFHAKCNNGEDVNVTAGEILYLPVDVEYESEWSTEGPGEYITFECNLFTKNHEEFVLYDRMIVIRKDKSGKYFKIFSEMYQCFLKDSTASGLYLVSHVYSFFGNLLEDSQRSSLKNDSATLEIYKGVVFLNDNYRSKISDEQLAEICNVSVSTFRRKFKQHYNMSPHDYLIQLRMIKARELLGSGMYNVSETAEFLGFSDASHFYKCFHNMYGISPKKYLNDNF